MKLPTCLAVLVVSASCAFAQTPAKSTHANLIFEGTFTEHSGGAASGWGEAGHAGGSHGNTVKVVDDPAGNYVVLSISKMESSNFMLNLTDAVTLQPAWKSVLCTVDMRVTNYTQGSLNHHKPRMHLSFFDDAGKELSSTGVSLASYSESWQTAKREVSVPAGATYVKVWLGTWGGTGQLAFRNPTITPVFTEAPAP